MSQRTLAFRGRDRLRSASPLSRPTNLSWVETLERPHGTTSVWFRKAAAVLIPSESNVSPLTFDSRGLPGLRTPTSICCSSLKNKVLTNVSHSSLRPVQVSLGPLSHRPSVCRRLANRDDDRRRRTVGMSALVVTLVSSTLSSPSPTRLAGPSPT